MLSTIIAVVALIAGATAGFLLARRGNPAKDLAEVLRRAGNGDFDVRAERGELGDRLNVVLERAAEAHAAAAQAVTTLAGERHRLGELRDRLAESAEHAVRDFGAIERTATGVCSDVSAVSAGADELGTSIEEISRNAAEALTVAADAAQLSAQTTQLMTKLGDSSAQIGDVVKVITSIAHQTNLLALNATIEAARAGEMGKGFAVVASEVKDLSQETAKATTSISEQIAAIQHDATGAVEAIRHVTEVIERINSYQTTISGAVREQSSTTYDMARGIADASSSAAEISSTIGAAVARAQAVRDEVALIDSVIAAMTGAQSRLG
jgi:methyl-accepting chemotaxis protein